MKKFIVSTLFVGALFSTVSLQAQDADHRQNTPPQRYYDRTGKDWHNWDDHEAQNYKRYQEEKHEKRDFSRLSKSQQDLYFRWQHQQSGDKR